MVASAGLLFFRKIINICVPSENKTSFIFTQKLDIANWRLLECESNFVVVPIGLEPMTSRM